MPQIMETYFWQPQFYQSLFKMPVNVPVEKGIPLLVPFLSFNGSRTKRGMATQRLAFLLFGHRIYLYCLPSAKFA